MKENTNKKNKMENDFFIKKKKQKRKPSKPSKIS